MSLESHVIWLSYPERILHFYTYFYPTTADASRNGVAQEAVQNMKRASKTMTDVEARQILGVTENASWEEIMQVSLVQW